MNLFNLRNLTFKTLSLMLGILFAWPGVVKAQELDEFTFGYNHLPWFPSDETTQELIERMEALEAELGLPVQWWTTPYILADIMYPQSRLAWEESGQSLLRFLIFGRPYYKDFDWNKDLELLVPDRLRGRLPQAVTDQVMQTVVIPLCQGQPVSLIMEGQRVDCQEPQRPDSLQQRAALRWGVESLLYYLQQGRLPTLVGAGPETYTAYFEAHPEQVGGFDDGSEGPSVDFPPTPIKDTVNDYRTAVKAVAAGRGPDYVRFRLEPAPDYPIPGLYAQTETGLPLPITDSSTLTLSSLPAGTHSVGIYAPIEGREDDLQLGRLTVEAYPEVVRHLHLIPVGDAQQIKWDAAKTQATAEALNAIYAATNVRWEVTQEARFTEEEWDHNYDGLHFGDNAFLSAYPPEAKALMRDWKRAHRAAGHTVNPQHYYLFLAHGGDYGKFGYMPRKRKFGFVFNNLLNEELPRIAKTIAHELGHGAFRFQHWWEETQTPQNGSDNLMDYRPEGTELRYHQWQQVRNPPFVVTLLEDEDEGAYMEYIDDTWTRNLNEIACALFKGEPQVALQMVRPGIRMPYYQFEVKFMRDEMLYGPQTLDLSSQEIYQVGDRTHLKWRIASTTDRYLHIHVATEDYATLAPLLTRAKRRTFRTMVDAALARPAADKLDYVAQLPTCSCELLSVVQRTSILGLIADESIINRNEEAQVNRLLSTTPKRDQGTILSYFAGTPLVLMSLYEGINHQSTRDEFLGWITSFWTQGDLAALKEEGHVSFDLTRGGLWDKVQERIDYQDDGQKLIFHEAYRTTESQDRGRYAVLVAVIQNREVFRVAPLDPVYVRMPGEAAPITLPALTVKNYTDAQNYEESIEKVKLGVDAALLLVGVGEIAVGFRALRVATSTPKFARALISMALGVGDVTATSLSSYCHTSASETEFCQIWNEIGPYIEVGLLSASMVDIFYQTLSRRVGDVIDRPDLPNETRLQLEEAFPASGRNYDHILERLSRRIIARMDAVFPDEAMRLKFLEDLNRDEYLIDFLTSRVHLVDTWRILEAAPRSIRANRDNLTKVSRFITATEMEPAKLISSLGNTPSPQKWVDMKIPEAELEAIYQRMLDDLPASFTAWTPEHKAQRWNNYQEGDGNLNFNTWSNNYDGNIDKAVAGNQSVRNYVSESGLNIPESGFERTWPDDITIDLRGQSITGKRRHDIFDEELSKAIEVKEYNTQKVSKSIDIEKEALMDIELLDQELIEEIEWVFIGNGPTGPLQELLESGGIKIIIK